ncbi:J domain-containing protein [Salmonella enterica]|nr:J domain-containing protein [Salmonella enterica]EIK0387649.1 J domain-containing protein [Salmonella enterica]
MIQSGNPVVVGVNGAEKEKNGLRELWEKVERYERRNEKATLKIDALYLDYEQTVMPYDRKMGGIRCQWLSHLMSFLDSKELKRRERQFLFEYIDEQLEQMCNSAFFYDTDVLRSLTERHEQYGDKLFKQERKQALERTCREISLMMKAAFGDDVEIPYSQIQDALGAGNEEAIAHIFEQISENYLFRHTDGGINEGAEWQDFEFSYVPDEDDDASTISEIFRGSQLSKIYRQVARVVHPDRESDPLRKEEKHRLMQQLVKARNEGDVITLVKMYGEFVPAGDISLDSEALEHVEHLLLMRLRMLNNIHRDIFNGQGFKTCVWKQFTASSKKKMREKMTCYIRDIGIGIRQMEKDIHDINSPRKVMTFIHSRFFSGF